MLTAASVRSGSLPPFAALRSNVSFRNFGQVVQHAAKIRPGIASLFVQTNSLIVKWNSLLISRGKSHLSHCFLCGNHGSRLEYQQNRQFFPVFSLLTGKFGTDWLAQNCLHSQTLSQIETMLSTCEITACYLMVVGYGARCRLQLGLRICVKWAKVCERHFRDPWYVVMVI